MTLVGTFQCLPEREHCPGKKLQVFACGIKMHFARRRNQWMAMKNDDFFLPLAREFVEPLE